MSTPRDSMVFPTTAANSSDDATSSGLRNRKPAPASGEMEEQRKDESAVDAYNADSSIKKREGPLRILMATEYLPPFVSGIANRCKNLIKGYREHGHIVTVAGPAGTEADIVVPSVPNIFYNLQRIFILPPPTLLFQLLDFSSEVPYDIVHIVAPLCLSFLLLLPLFKLRGVKIYVSYHVYLEYYKQLYFGDNMILGMFLEGIFTIFYFIPLVWFAHTVGIPSKTADYVVFKYSRRIHYMKSGLDVKVFSPLPENYCAEDDSMDAAPLPIPQSLLPTPGFDTTIAPLSHEQSLTSPNSIKQFPVFVYVGRLAVEKNVEFLITSLKHPSLQTASLVIVGDGPIRPALEALAADTVGAGEVYSYDDVSAEPRPFGLGADGTVSGKRYRVLFVGMVRNEREVSTGYYARADVFVSASGSETFGFTVAEAMACGTPAVVVRSGAFATVYGMIDGWMFEEENVDDYAGRIVRVLKDGMLARRVARRVAVRGFSVDSAIRDLLKTYEWCVDGEGKDMKRIDL
ncbi:hypothetical protein DFJ73DRAFT_764768 [Zopfochytrium polystomum]|nr:hypothetical protein DFJ73DRAFT_764768 [Zopfochytrium polystomum]